MHTFAYCCAQFANATQQAAGVTPWLSPPVTADTLPVHWWLTPDYHPYQFYYFDLHGDAEMPYWYTVVDGAQVISLWNWQIKAANLRDAIVFTANCHVGDEQSPMLDALLGAGARYVIAGSGPNFGPVSNASYGAPLLGRWLRRLIGAGMDPLYALQLAKARLKAGRKIAIDDTLEFKAFYRAREDERV